jgi:hypothetical protein
MTTYSEMAVDALSGNNRHQFKNIWQGEKHSETKQAEKSCAATFGTNLTVL